MQKLLPHIERVMDLTKPAEAAAPLAFPVKEDVVGRMDRTAGGAFKDFAEREEGRRMPERAARAAKEKTAS